MHKDEEIIICRCEDITLDEIRRAIRQGYTDFEELKRYLRVGMGPCQGRTCTSLIRRELARFLGKSVAEIQPPTKRPPAVNVLIGVIHSGREES
ncbi:(2Fe-2S)-binding protein [bacterium]|nr:MAG: (2Fe-2S)-binding protein [bacterium]